MNRLWVVLGRAAYVVVRPLMYLYLKDSQRTRIIVRTDDKILLLKDWLGDGSWKFPGGGVHKNEEVVHAACRELHEETGINLAAQQLKEAGNLQLSSQAINIQLHIFIAKLDNPWPVKKQPFEIVEIEWDNIADINQFKLSADTATVLRKIGLTL